MKKNDHLLILMLLSEPSCLCPGTQKEFETYSFLNKSLCFTSLL